MKRKLTSILLMSALLVGGASTFVSCKDYDGDQAAVSNANVKGLSDKLNEQITALEALKTDINGKLNGKADQSVVEALGLKVDNAIAGLQNQIDAIKSCGCDLTELLATQAFVNSIKDDLTALLAKDLVTSDQLEDLLTEEDITTLRTGMEALNTLLGPNLENAVTRTDLADYAKSADLSNYALATDLDSYLKTENFSGQLVSSLNTLLENAGLENITNVYELFAQIDKIASMDESIQELASQCALLAGKYSLLNDKIDSLVTGVNVDMVKNPIYGTLNTPFGLKSYVLAGFVGDEIKNTPFYQENGVWQTINSEEKVAASANGGSVYLTVNPSTINAEGWNIGRLVGRDGTVAPGYGELVLAADNTPVTTRATNNLGGYVATAVFDNPAAAKINVNKEELTDVAKNVLGALRREESLNITNAVGTIYKTFANAIDQYYGINVKYGKDGKQSYTSSYDIAAVTIKPLSYNTLAGKGYEIKSIPQLQDILGIDFADYQFTWENLKHLDPMKKYITVDIPNTDDIKINGIPAPGVTIDDSKLEVIKKEDYLKDDNGNYVLDKDGNKIKTIVDVKVNILEGLVTVGEINLDNATVILGPDKQEKFEVVIEMDEFNDMIDEINSNVGGMLSNVNELVDKVQSGFDKINNNVITRLNKVIAKANKILGNPNALLQPVMLYNDANGAGRLSESSIAPTRFNLNGKSEGAITLVATSYTGEMLAPAWKKHISVEGEGASVNVSGVIDGAQKVITFTAKPGKYTINYDAIDFYGKVRNKKYYVEVK
ncbi:MAG: hypothetical protein PUI49_08125 [Prevotellaceae bacterium]|nr:hypothetical protein [Prevotellaceae bacterium]MDY5210617.1 hypothetical protein [Prevotella sp.]